MSPVPITYVTLADAKDHLGIDDGLTIHDRRIALCIGAAEDIAQNYTQRSLAELMVLDSPADDDVSPASDPDPLPWNPAFPRPDYLDIPQAGWTQDYWQNYWYYNPPAQDQSKPLRRDVYSALLLYTESLFDRNSDNMTMLQATALNLLAPYRRAMGV